MPELPDFTCYLSAEAASFVVGLPKQKQRNVIDLVERIGASPEFISDYQDHRQLHNSSETRFPESSIFAKLGLAFRAERFLL